MQESLSLSLQCKALEAEIDQHRFRQAAAHAGHWHAIQTSSSAIGLCLVGAGTVTLDQTTEAYVHRVLAAPHHEAQPGCSTDSTLCW